MRMLLVSLLVVSACSKSDLPPPDAAPPDALPHDRGALDGAGERARPDSRPRPPDLRPEAAAPAAWKEVKSAGSDQLLAIWGASASNIFVVGKAGAMLRHDGKSWSAMSSGSTNDLHAVWGTGSTVYAAGDNTILVFDGQSWKEDPDYYGYGSDAFRGLWGSSASDVRVVGAGGSIQRKDAGYWNDETTGTTQDLNAIWGASATEIFVVGRAGTILKGDGKAWTKQASGTSSDLQAVWGSAANDVWAAGLDGAVLHYDGKAWSSAGPASSSYFFGVWGAGKLVFVVGNPVFKADESVFRWDGASWSKMSAPKLLAFEAIWGVSASDVYALAKSSILHYDGK
jgi:hypothetical protein